MVFFQSVYADGRLEGSCDLSAATRAKQPFVVSFGRESEARVHASTVTYRTPSRDNATERRDDWDCSSAHVSYA